MTRWSGSALMRSKTPVTGRGGDRNARAARAIGSGDAARERRARGAVPGARGVALGCGGGGHQTAPPACGRRAGGRTSRAGSAAISPGVGTTERRNTSSASGVRPQRADRQVGRADAALRAVGEEALDAPVLQRVERDRGEPAGRAQQLPGERERLVELVELAVDRDPDRLEGALGRVAAAEPRGRGDRGGDGVDELEGGGESAAAADDLPRDPLGVALLAVLAQRAREAAALPRVDDLGGGQLLRRVHAHVERRVVGVGEAALARVDLHRGHPEVEVDEVGLEALLLQQLEPVRRSRRG